MTRSPLPLFLFPLFALAGCVPEFDDDGTRIENRRIIAIESSPAEVDLRLVTASGDVELTAVVADALDRGAENVRWTLCIDRKPLSELGPVDSSCLNGGGDALVPLGSGASVSSYGSAV